MDRVHGVVMKWALDQKLPLSEVEQTPENKDKSDDQILIPRMKRGDENVYELTLHPDKSIAQLAKLKTDLGIDVCKNLHFRVFKINQIAKKNYFLKEYLYNSDWYCADGTMKNLDALSLKSKVEFKGVERCFMPQVLKFYTAQPIVHEDLLFMHSGFLAKYQTTIFG